MTSDLDIATRTPGPAGILFLREMALSPVVAASQCSYPLLRIGERTSTFQQSFGW